MRSVLFRAPLEEYLRSGITQFSISQPGFDAFLTTYNDGRWVLIFPDDEQRDEATLRAHVQKALLAAMCPSRTSPPAAGK